MKMQLTKAGEPSSRACHRQKSASWWGSAPTFATHNNPRPRACCTGALRLWIHSRSGPIRDRQWEPWPWSRNRYPRRSRSCISTAEKHQQCWCHWFCLCSHWIERMKQVITWFTSSTFVPIPLFGTGIPNPRMISIDTCENAQSFWVISARWWIQLDMIHKLTYSWTLSCRVAPIRDEVRKRGALAFHPFFNSPFIAKKKTIQELSTA